MGWFDRIFGTATTEEGHQTLDDLTEGAFPEGPLTVTDGDFKALIERFPLVVVDCWAAWCMPCRMIAPVISELATAHQEEIVFAKLNVDENPVISREYNVMSIPTLLVFRDGELVDEIVGAMPKKDLETRLLQYVERT